MKKILSVILAVAVVMSLFCMVPASAEDIKTWPYFYEDFEDNASSLTNLTVVKNGVNGSGYAAQYTDTADNRDDDFSFGSFQGWICNGDTIKFTAKLKLAQEIDEGEARLLFHIAGGSNTQYNAEAYPNGNAWFTVNGGNLSLSFDRTSTDWQTISYTGVYTGVDVYTGEKTAPSFRLRVAKDQSFLIDDVEFSILKENPEETPLDKVLYSNDFETNADGVAAGSTVEATHITNATGDAYKGAGYLRFTDDKTNDVPKMNITLSEDLEAGVRYYIGFKVRYSEAYKTYSYDYDPSTGFAALESPEALAETEYLRCRIAFDNETYVNRNVVQNNDTWTEVAFTIQTTRASALTNVIPVHFWGNFQPGGSPWSGSDKGIIEIDNIFVKKYNGVLNGDGEISQNGHALLDDANYTGNGATTKGIVGWANASKSPLQQNASLRSGEGQITAYSTDYGQKTTTTMLVEAGKTYKLTAWGRGSGANATGDIQFGADYTLSDSTTSSAVIATIEQNKNGAFWEFQYGEGTFTVPANVTSAKLYVTMLEAKNENQDTSRLTSSGNLAMYIDDVALIEVPSANTPVVTASATTAAGGVVTVAKTATAPQDVTVTSVVKLTATKNGVKSYIGSTTGTAITVPESYYTGYTLAAEITPVASNGYIGKTVTIEVPAVPVVVGTTFTATAADGATLTAAEATEGLVIWAAYDANGKMLDWSSAPMSVTAGGTQTVAVPLDFDATGAAEVKVMLWADMIACKPLADHVAY